MTNFINLDEFYLVDIQDNISSVTFQNEGW